VIPLLCRDLAAIKTDIHITDMSALGLGLLFYRLDLWSLHQEKKICVPTETVLDALRALGKMLDSNLALIRSWHAGNSQDVASPSKRYARRGIYYPRRIPYSFPLEGSPEVELSCPRSASDQMLHRAARQQPTQNTLLISIGR